MSSEGSSSPPRRGNTAGGKEGRPRLFGTSAKAKCWSKEMSGVPDLFMTGAIVSKAAPSAAAPESTIMPSPANVIATGPESTCKKRKLRKEDISEGAPLKKQAVTATPSSSISTVGSTFGRLAEKHVSEEEFKVWKMRTEEQQREAIRRATTELFFHNLTYDDKLSVHQVRLRELEIENNKFKKKIKELRSKLKTLREEKSAAENSLSELKNEFEQTMKDKDASLASLKDDYTKLANENKNLKADQANGWAKEKERIKDEAFQDGFRSCLKTFMAADPDYNWTSHFGESVGKWMADFAIMEAKAIAEKKAQVQAQLEREKAQPSSFTRVENDADQDDANDEEDQEAEDQVQ